MLSCAVALLAVSAQGPVTVVPNLWTREPNAGTCVADAAVARGGKPTFRIRHTSASDWAMELGGPVSARPGQVFKLASDLKIEGAGTAGVSFVVRRGDEVMEWLAGERPLRAMGDWQTSTASVLIPEDATSVQPRLIGNGPATVWIGSVTLSSRFVGTLPKTTQPVVLESRALRVEVDPATLAVTTEDKRTGRKWAHRAPTPAIRATSFAGKGRELAVNALAPDGEGELKLSLELDANKPEMATRVEGKGPMSRSIAFPGALAATKETEHILPVNMGIGFRADDPAIEDQWLVGYGGHGLCMGFFGQIEGGAGVLSIVDRSDDFLLTVRRREGILEAQPTWVPEKGRFGYGRSLRTVYFDKADPTALALRYREHAKQAGLVKTLAEKAKANPLVARVARAANLWTWGPKLPLARAVAGAGMKDVLWSGGGNPSELQEFRNLGFLVGRYDIYQDVMDPSRFADLPWTHPDWTTEAWPDKLVRNADGDWVKGWVVQDKQGKDVPCAVCCDVEALPFARSRIAKELEDHPYQARFIDTTTASEYRECYDPRHPMTRTQSRQARMKLLQMVTDFGLVAGSETGHEASVPHLVYYEGMMSLGPYRVADAGTDPPKIYEELPERVKTFQLGPKYRLPLWQLVYGDSTVSTWYWGDFNNKHLGTWDLRDLWNVLYGTPPMYFTDAAGFEKHRDRFVESYRKIASVLRHTAMRRMVAHRYLTPDRTVQQTQWDNGLRITVNFGDRPYGELPPKSHTATFGNAAGTRSAGFSLHGSADFSLRHTGSRRLAAQN
ncbi:MAG TPA: glycoside hydrolase [Fimbriimonas sp.]